MRIVQHAAVRPNHCAALPYMGNLNASGFIDTGSELDGFDNHVYISFEAAAEMARMIGWSSPSQFDSVAAENTQLRERIAALEAEVSELAHVVDAVEVVQRRQEVPA